MKCASCAVAVLVCSAAFCRAATLVSYPYLQNVRGDRATILWAAIERGSGVVRYSSDHAFSLTVVASVREFLPSQTGLTSPFYQYQAELTGLTSATDYFYRVIVDGQDLTPGDELRFRTAGGNPFKFLVFGDSGQGTLEQRALAARMLQENPIPALVLHAGDLAYDSGTFSQFQERHFGIYRDLMKRVPFFPTPGNHEYETADAAPYLALHAVPRESVPLEDRGRYYSFDWGPVHFVSLDSNRPLRDAVNEIGQMLEWLENDLRQSRRFWSVVYFHHAPYATGRNQNDPVLPLVRSYIVPILERYGVPLVFNGHEHSYQRSYPLRNGAIVEAGAGTVYITTGGGGASLYPVFPDSRLAVEQSVHHFLRVEVDNIRMTLRAVGIDGQEIDSVTLAPAPMVSSGSVVDAASFGPSLAPGGLVAIFGQHLAGVETMASRMPLPKELSGTAVTLSGQPLPLFYVSPTQIYAQLPYDVQGLVPLRVTTPNGSTESTIVVSEAAPAIFLVAGNLGVFPAITHSNGALVTFQAPAQPGESVTVYLTGCGAVNGPIDAGQTAPNFPPLLTRLPVTVEIGNLLFIPSFAGLTPGFVGICQANLQIPSNMLAGIYLLRINVGTNFRSRAVALIVR